MHLQTCSGTELCYEQLNLSDLYKSCRFAYSQTFTILSGYEYRDRIKKYVRGEEAG